MIRDFLNEILFTYETFNLTIGQVIALAILLLASIFLYRVIKHKKLTSFFDRNKVESVARTKFYKLIRFFLLLLVILMAVIALKLDFILREGETINLSVSLILEGLLIIYAARIIDWFISNVLVHGYYTGRQNLNRNEALPVKDEAGATRTVQYIVYLFALFLILRNFNLDFTIFDTSYNDNKFEFKLTNIVAAVLVMLIGKFIIDILTQIILFSVYQKQKIDVGVQYALNQLLKYVIFVIAAVIALQYLGINMTLIWGGAAALLVGLGLGLQQTFNDLFSGLLLLFERSVKIGDVLELNDGTIGTVQKIGLRTTMLLSRGNRSLIVPNSSFTNKSVINWSFENNKIRFKIPVSVAYGTDTELVKSILLKTGKNNPYVLDYPAPFVRFLQFGESALDFQLYFFSTNFIVIEDIKSDLRFEIDRLFREHNIEIPFPQRVIYTKPL